MMGHKEKLKDGEENELTSRWRKRGWLSRRTGEWKKIKRRINKRIRKINKLKIRKDKLNDNN